MERLLLWQYRRWLHLECEHPASICRILSPGRTSSLSQGWHPHRPVSIRRASRSKFLASFVSYHQGLVTLRFGLRESWATNNILKKERKEKKNQKPKTKGHFCLQNFHSARQKAIIPDYVGSILDTWQSRLRGLSVLIRERFQEQDAH